MTDTACLGEFGQLVRSRSCVSAATPAAPRWRPLEEQAGRCARATLYTTLDRLEAKGLLRWKLGLGGPERQSLSRRPCSVTPRRIAPRINHHG